MLVSYLTKNLGYEYIGEDTDINLIKFSEEADKFSIAVCKDCSEIEKTDANVVLVSAGIYITKKTIIFPCDSQECAIVRICNLLIAQGYYQDYSMRVSYNLQPGGYYLGDGCVVSDTAIIQPGVMIGNDVVVGDRTFIDSFSIIGSGTVIKNNVQIKAGCKIAADSFFHYSDCDDNIKEFVGCGNVRILSNTCIGYNTIIQRGTISDTFISENCKIGNLVDIGHDVRIGKSCKIVSQSGIAGGAVLKDNVIIYGQSGITNDVTVGNNVIVKGKTSVSKSIEDNQVVFGRFGRKFSDEIKLEAKIRRFFAGKDE